MGFSESKSIQEITSYDQSTKIEHACATGATMAVDPPQNRSLWCRLTHRGKHLTTLPESIESVGARFLQPNEELAMVRIAIMRLKEVEHRIRESSAPAAQKDQELNAVRAKYHGLDLELDRLHEEYKNIGQALDRLRLKNHRERRRLRIRIAVTLVAGVLYCSWLIWTVTHGTFARDTEQLSGLIRRLLGKVH